MIPAHADFAKWVANNPHLFGSKEIWKVVKESNLIEVTKKGKHIFKTKQNDSRTTPNPPLQGNS